jgi:hypothetical protein
MTENSPASPANRPPAAAIEAFGLSVDAWGRIVLIDTDGRRHVGVEPVRAFPITDPDHWVSICDAEGHEILCVNDLSGLAVATRLVLEDELAKREFVPIIRRVIQISNESNPAEWDVETDRGPTRFTVDGDEAVRRIGTHHVLITDTRGLRYLVPDVRALDLASRRRLERFF